MAFDFFYYFEFFFEGYLLKLYLDNNINHRWKNTLEYLEFTLKKNGTLE